MVDPIDSSLSKELVQIARDVDDAEGFDAGAVGQSAVENRGVGEFGDDPGADVLVTAKLVLSALGDCGLRGRSHRKWLPGARWRRGDSHALGSTRVNTPSVPRIAESASFSP